MTELHNMSVPPRTILRIARQALSGQRYRLNLLEALGRPSDERDASFALHRLRRDGIEYLLELLGMPLAAAGAFEATCAAALADVGLPPHVGFFVGEGDDGETRVSPAATVAILAARSGPVYLPGRFAPSLITFRPVALFFPDLEDAE